MEFVPRECVQALIVQWTITVWSVSESTWGLEWSEERRKSEKFRSRHNWINTQLKAESQQYQHVSELLDREWKVKCALENGQSKAFMTFKSGNSLNPLAFPGLMHKDAFHVLWMCSSPLLAHAYFTHTSHSGPGTHLSSEKPGYIVLLLSAHFC